MPQASRTIVIRRPVEDVFAFFTDPANDRVWRPAVKEIRSEGVPEVGTTIHQVIAGPMGRGIPADIEVTTYQPTSRYAFRGVTGPVRPEGSYTFAPVEGGTATEVTFSLTTELGGVKRVMGKGVQRSMDAEMAGLDRAKAALER